MEKQDFLDQDDFSETDSVSQEVLEQYGINEEINLVDLIEQPAWKTILYELVKRNKMDPWNIDVAILADKFLEKIQSVDDTDLRLPANAILASAILLKFKASLLRLTSLEPEEKGMTEEEKKLIDQMLPNLESDRKERMGKVSLDDLVNAIDSMLQKTKKTKTSKKLLREKPEFLVPAEQFNIEKQMNKIYELIKSKVDSQGLVLFSALIDKNSITNIVESFLPLLFLANHQKINIWQEEFFDEIFIALNDSISHKKREEIEQKIVEIEEKEDFSDAEEIKEEKEKS